MNIFVVCQYASQGNQVASVEGDPENIVIPLGSASVKNLRDGITQSSVDGSWPIAVTGTNVDDLMISCETGSDTTKKLTIGGIEVDAIGGTDADAIADCDDRGAALRQQGNAFFSFFLLTFVAVYLQIAL